MTEPEPELNERGYPKILDKVLEITGYTYDDIEEMQEEERQEFSDWVDTINLEKRIARGEIAMLDTEEEEYSFKMQGGKHE